MDELTIAFDANADYWLDAAVVSAPLTAAPSTAHLAASLAVYAGDLLPGFYDDWVILARVRLEAIFESKMRLLFEQQLAAGCWADAAGSAERWIALGHTPEAAYCALMVAHAALGDRSRVASAYRRCVEDLRGGLGVEPSRGDSRASRAAGERECLGGVAQPVTFTLPERVAPQPADDLPAHGKPPFKGLQHFEPADAGLSFGRARGDGHAGRSPAPPRSRHRRRRIGERQVLVGAPGLLPALSAASCLLAAAVRRRIRANGSTISSRPVVIRSRRLPWR